MESGLDEGLSDGLLSAKMCFFVERYLKALFFFQLFEKSHLQPVGVGFVSRVVLTEKIILKMIDVHPGMPIVTS